MANYEHKLRAIRVVKEWFDQAQEPIVMSTGHLDLLLGCIEQALPVTWPASRKKPDPPRLA